MMGMLCLPVEGDSPAEGGRSSLVADVSLRRIRFYGVWRRWMPSRLGAVAVFTNQLIRKRKLVSLKL